MSTLLDWAAGALLASTILMLVVLAVRLPARRWIGPRLGYALWALPMVRLVMPPLPAGLFGAFPPALRTGTGASVLAVGPRVSGLWASLPATPWHLDPALLALWLGGAVALLGVHVDRHVRFRRRLLASATALGARGAIRIVAADVDGPLAFGIVHRTIAVPRDFAARYDRHEQRLALAHECAHHMRGDLVANWGALVVLALHWWNPVAWVAIRAFREDQEFAVDAQVLARSGPGARSTYAHVLAKATGLGSLSVCTLNPRSNLKGRLIMLAQNPLPKSRLIVGGSALTLLAAATLAATVPVASAATPAGSQAVTIGVKPDGAGGYALIVGGTAVAADARLPGGATLPADFDPHGGCDLKPTAEARAMVLKGSGGVTTYTVMCASAKPASLRVTLDEGLVSLRKMRGSVATQPASPQFPEAERRHALGAIDRSIHEVETTLAKTS